jgi:DNA-directed RNA polymerase subunit RPC12/RpoP
MKADDPWAFNMLWDADGKYTYADADKNVKATKTYYLGGKQLRPVKYKGAAHCELIESIKNEALYLCPNCGAESTLDGLLDGCDFCGAKFNVDDFNLKVNSFSLRPDPAGQLFSLTGWLSDHQSSVQRFGFIGFGCLFLAFIVGNFVRGMPYLESPIDVVANFFMSALVSVIPVVAVGMALLMIYLLLSATLAIYAFFRMGQSAAAQSRRHRTQAGFERSVQQHDEFFSQGAFTSNLENKLLTIIYAGSPTEMGAISAIDPAPLLARYADVCDVNMTGLRFDSFRTDEYLQRVALTVSVELLRLKGDRISKTKESIMLAVAKDKSCRTVAACEVSLLRCVGCGNSLSLLDGAVCPYCGRRLESWRLDWMITDFIPR